MIRIIIADDYAIMREGLKQILADTKDMRVCGEACDGSELLEKVLRNKYDVAVSDFSMPGMNILDAITQIKRERPGIQILILSMHPEQEYTVRVLKAGASGYLTKESAPAELVKAIRKVHSGKKYIGPHCVETLRDFL